MRAPHSDAMHDTLSLMLDLTECCECRQRPDLMWAWDGVDKLTITKDAALAASTFAEAAAAQLKSLGWCMIGDAIYCPRCAAELAPAVHRATT